MGSEKRRDVQHDGESRGSRRMDQLLGDRAQGQVAPNGVDGELISGF
jgi:hypothetical protein